MRKLLFLFRFLGKKSFEAPYLYQVGPEEIQEWDEQLPWYRGDTLHFDKNNYLQYGKNEGVFTISARMYPSSSRHHSAVWLLNITHEKSYEELDFEIMYSKKKKRDYLYISSYINHKNSHQHDPETGKLVSKKWQKRICSRRLIRSLTSEHHEYTFEIRNGKIRYYIDNLLVATQRATIIQPMYFVLSYVDASFVSIRE